jgi:hypothetical protein
MIKQYDCYGNEVPEFCGDCKEKDLIINKLVFDMEKLEQRIVELECDKETWFTKYHDTRALLHKMKQCGNCKNDWAVDGGGHVVDKDVYLNKCNNCNDREMWELK